MQLFNDSVALFLCFIASVSVNATLIDRGGGLIYDDVLNITWLQNAFLASPNTFKWQESVDWADTLSFGSFSDWRLASMSVSGGLPTGSAATVVDCQSATEVACRDNELGYMYWQNLGGNNINLTGNQTVGGVTLNNIQSVYWSSTEFPSVQNGARAFQFTNGGQGFNFKDRGFFAWAVRDGDVLMVSEPSTLGLLCAGLVGLIVRRPRAVVRQ